MVVSRLAYCLVEPAIQNCDGRMVVGRDGCSGVSLFTAGLTLKRWLRQYLFARVGSVHTTRLLNSAQPGSIMDFGIGGFLLFQRDYGGEFPEQLYKVTCFLMRCLISLDCPSARGWLCCRSVCDP